MNEKDDWTLRMGAKRFLPCRGNLTRPSFFFLRFFLWSNIPSLDFFVSRSIGRIGNIGKKGCEGGLVRY